ncbi:MAG: hypothetical protein ACTSXT_06785 [Candidatus Helarchaeota archaeon]
MVQSYVSQYFDTNVYLFISVIIIESILLMIVLYNYNKKKTKYDGTTRRNIIIWGYFFLIIIITSIIILIWKINYNYWDYEIKDIVERISNILIFLACLIKVYDVEKVLNESKNYKGYYFSILMLIVMIIMVFISPSLLKTISIIQIILIIFIFAGFSIFPIIYLYLAVKSGGEVRYNSLKVSAGAVFIGLGFLFRYENLIGYLNINPILDQLIDFLNITSPISIIIGIILIFWSFLNVLKLK